MDQLLPFFLAGVLVTACILFAVIVMTRKAPKALNREKYQSDWLAIEKSLDASQGSQQLAIFNADKLLDRALKDLRYQGETMGERMAAAGRIFSRCDAIWAAHKLRNRLAHEDDVRLTPKLTKRALASFKQGLKDLGAL